MQITKIMSNILTAITSLFLLIMSSFIFSACNSPNDNNSSLKKENYVEAISSINTLLNSVKSNTTEPTYPEIVSCDLDYTINKTDLKRLTYNQIKLDIDSSGTETGIEYLPQVTNMLNKILQHKSIIIDNKPIKAYMYSDKDNNMTLEEAKDLGYFIWANYEKNITTIKLMWTQKTNIDKYVQNNTTLAINYDYETKSLNSFQFSMIKYYPNNNNSIINYIQFSKDNLFSYFFKQDLDTSQNNIDTYEQQFINKWEELRAAGYTKIDHNILNIITQKQTQKTNSDYLEAISTVDTLMNSIKSSSTTEPTYPDIVPFNIDYKANKADLKRLTYTQIKSDLDGIGTETGLEYLPEMTNMLNLILGNKSIIIENKPIKAYMYSDTNNSMTLEEAKEFGFYIWATYSDNKTIIRLMNNNKTTDTLLNSLHTLAIDYDYEAKILKGFQFTMIYFDTTTQNSTKLYIQYTNKNFFSYYYKIDGKTPTNIDTYEQQFINKCNTIKSMDCKILDLNIYDVINKK